MGEEVGHLPGSPDPEEMLSTDLEEARARYLRAVYFSFPCDKRANQLWEVVRRFGYEIGENLNLESVINTELEALPDFEEFLSGWINLLRKEKSREADYLLREAVRLSCGTVAIEKLAREEGKKYPRAYVDWINALEKGKDFQTMVKAAKQGLENVPKQYIVRAEIACGDFYVKKEDVEKHFEKAMDKVFLSLHLSVQEENEYLDWCIKKSGLRINAIVSGKHRQSYGKAANLLLALAEVIANREEKEKGAKLIERYKQKYSNYSAFRRELREAVKKSEIFPEN